MPFLDNLTRLMNRHGVNRTELAKKIGIAPSTINSWYNRSYENISLKTLIKLSSFFNVSLEELVHDTHEKTITFSSKDYTDEELRAISNLGKFLKNHRKDE